MSVRVCVSGVLGYKVLPRRRGHCVVADPAPNGHASDCGGGQQHYMLTGVLLNLWYCVGDLRSSSSLTQGGYVLDSL